MFSAAVSFRIRILLSLAVWLVWSYDSTAQRSNQWCDQVSGTSFYWPDSLIVDPSSIELSPEQDYQLDSAQTGIRFEKPFAGEVCFRYFPITKGQVYSHKSAALYDSTASFKQVVYARDPLYEKEELFETPEIYKSGSLTRGVSFGNTQSMNVISGFNFQMDGKLTDDLNIRADITDQNVPFQPEGNTQQIREFDNVTFEIYNDTLSLIAGDVVLKNNPNSYFMRHYKNALGGQLSVDYGLGESSGRSSLAVAAAKGQFADITLTAVEGLQGPYQLTGATGQYVVVLANSEKVYLDGQLLKRGFNNDYVIDYNLGEVTFTPSVMITQFSRIRVTYEYSDQNYSRSIIAAQQELDLGKVKIQAGYYREKDNRNRPLAFTLSDEEKQQIADAGEDNIPVPISGAKSSDYLSELVQYEQIDTTDLEGVSHQVYVYSRDSTASLYRVTFSEVGSGNGSYVLLENDVNGRVYEWQSPVEGVMQGSYAPVQFIPAPNMRELVTLRTDIALTKQLNLFTEVAFSNQDKNLYSELEDEDNKDWAIKSGLRWDQKQIGAYKLSAQLDYERDGADFQPIDRYRDIEYDRNWSYEPSEDTMRTVDHIANAAIELVKDNNNLLEARYSLRSKSEAVEGYQIDLAAAQGFGGLKLRMDYFNLESQNLTEQTQWSQWYGDAFFDRWLIVPGYRYELDRNEVSALEMDSLLRTVMNYESHQFYLRNHDTLRTQFRLDYTVREDQSVLNGELLPYSRSQTSRVQINTQITRDQDISLNFSYRALQYQEAFDDLDDESLILGSLNYRGSFLDGHVRTDMNYTTSSSREILREFVFVEVATGEGTHAWRDLNEDGVQDLTEFFEAVNFDERRYIKVYVPTSEYIEAYHTIFNLTANLSMPKGWKGSGGFKGFLSQFTNNSSVNISKKSSADGLNDRFNPFALEVEDVNLVFVREGLRSTLFFNRSGRGLGWDLTYASNSAKQLISRGIESRTSQEWQANIRYHLGQEWVMSLELLDQVKENSSQYQEDNNYLISSTELSPGLVWQPTNNFRMSLDYSYSEKLNDETDTKEKSLLHTVESESRWSNGTKNALTAYLAYTQISYDGDLNTAAAYELLNALQPGHNYSWRINYSQKLMSGLQMSIGYEGRKSADGPVIHTGRMQVTALF